MVADLLLGIDVGTHGVKTALVQPSGKVVAQTQIEHATYSPRPDWVEQDMHKDWWLDSVQVIRKVLQTEGVNPKQIRAIGVSGLYPALGPTDEEGNPLSGAILYSDNRSVAEVDEVNIACNLRLSSEELTPKLIWFLRNELELAAEMKMFFDASHYLIYKLTGAYVTDTITTGLYGAIYESPSASWRAEVCARFGIPLEILPKVQPPAHIAGNVHRQAAEITGLAEGTPVVSGMPDLYASMLSAGVVHTWESIAYYGSGGVLPVMKDEALNAALKPFPVAERGGKIQEGYLYDYPVYCLSVGDGVHWFREHFGSLEVEAARIEGGLSAYARLDNLAVRVPAGSDGLIFLPYLQGQRSPEFDPWASGVYFGLKNIHGRGHLFRALLESWGYAIRFGLECFYPQGNPLRRLVATGGGARSSLWRQIVSDITGLPQDYVVEADGPLGAAYVAGLAVGLFRDFEVLQKQWVNVSAVTKPDPQAQKVYDAYYTIFVELHPTLKATYRHHHEVQNLIGV
jgi:sugar (pentulose or hexulose) kinase